MAISGIFFTFAMNMFSTANNSFFNYKKSHEEYFDYNVMRAKADNMLRTNPGECSNDSLFKFTGNYADSLNKSFPFPFPKCKKLDRYRSLIFFLGKIDSSSREIYAYSLVKSTSIEW